MNPFVPSPARRCRLPWGGLLSMALLGAGVFTPPLAAQVHDHPDGVAMVVPPEMPLMTSVLGPFSRPVTTAVPAAQAYFDQGMQFLYAFTHSAAIRSFEEAQRQDPSCAMCYWGEALARGPFLNAGMSGANAGPAYAAAMEAVRIAGTTEVTEVERALIDALSVRYAERHDPDTRAQLDSAYSRAMADAWRAYPRDLDVGTLYAESLMLLNTNRGAYRLDDPFVQSFHRVLEDVLALDLRHPGACHLYVHGTEATEAPEKAEACADYLGDTVPGASHINHMPSHTYNRIGRWGSAVTANIQAWHSDQRAQWGEGVSYASSHNLHMLFFAASMDGQAAVAIDAARAYAEAVPNGQFYEALVLLRFGRFDEILAMEAPPEPPIQLGLWEFAKGYAHLRAGEVDAARDYLARLERAAIATPANVAMRGHSAADLLGIAGRILRAEVLLHEGNPQAAAAVLERAVEMHDGLRYDEPEPLNFSPRHWLGAILLETGQPAEAQAVYEASLVQHPRNGWSLYGLEQALRAQGLHAEADEVRAQFRRDWARADTLIRSSRF